MKKTGMHPATMASNVERRDGVSSGGCRQKLALSMGRMYATGLSPHAAAKQSTTTHTTEVLEGVVVVRLAHSARMAPRMLGLAGLETAPA